MKKTNLYSISDKAAYVLLCVLMADCAIFGAGRTLEIGPFGFRMIVVGATMVVSLPILLRDIGKIVKNKFFWMLVAFAGWLVVQTVRGMQGGNEMAQIMSDLKGFSYFVIFLPALCVLNSKERIHTLMKVMMYATLALSGLALFLLCTYNWFPDVFLAFYKFDYNHYISGLAGVSDSVVRLFFKSSVYLLCGCAFPLYFIANTDSKKQKIGYSMIVGLSLFVLLLSYTRSIYLAVAVAAVVLVVGVVWLGERSQRKAVWKGIGGALVTFCILLVSFSLMMGTNYFSYGLERLGVSFLTLEPEVTADPTEATAQTVETTQTEPVQQEPVDSQTGTEQYQQQTIISDNIRRQTSEELWQWIKQSPLIGHGLGKTLDVREGGNNEYFYLDMLMKTGIIGLILYLMPILAMLVMLVKRGRKDTKSGILVANWISVLLGIATSSYFNPYMNAALGVLCYCCVMAVSCFALTNKEPSGRIGTA